uniref:Radical SAM core domain-containing protein n=1 Tax=Candidatus Kentrum sp. SD TaxID=2126332 RepID=A0A451BMN7_9GAMM|nr:MAG: uncharacterized protein BECKSD772D_GA0070982_10538 [Candidatus Kentron sp. SD]
MVSAPAVTNGDARAVQASADGNALRQHPTSIPVAKLQPRKFSLVVRPVGDSCNLRCAYCYLAEGVAAPLRIMAPEMGRALARQCAHSFDEAHILWHGGEPLLAGIEFFQGVLAEQQVHPQCRFTNFLQTNGTTITPRVADFLARNHFHVRLSLDGPEHVHNRFRKTEGEKGTFGRVLTAIERLRGAGVEPHISCVMTDESVAEIPAIYDLLLEQGILNASFLPAFHARDDEILAPTLSPDGYVVAYLKLFDIWSRDRSGMRIREIEWMVSGLLGSPRGGDCTYSGQCGDIMRLEPDGAFYACEVLDSGQKHAAAPMGTFGRLPLTNLPAVARLAHRAIPASPPLPTTCADCEWFRLCHGGCPAVRVRGEGDSIGDFYYCSARKALFEGFRERLGNT